MFRKMRKSITNHLMGITIYALVIMVFKIGHFMNLSSGFKASEMSLMLGFTLLSWMLVAYLVFVFSVWIENAVKSNKPLARPVILVILALVSVKVSLFLLSAVSMQWPMQVLLAVILGVIMELTVLRSQPSK